MTIFQVPKWQIAGDLLTEQTWSDDVCQGAKDSAVEIAFAIGLVVCCFFFTVYLVSKAEKEIWDTVNGNPKKAGGGRWGQKDRLEGTIAVLSMKGKDANSVF